jgi:hypothetical protein
MWLTIRRKRMDDIFSFIVGTGKDRVQFDVHKDLLSTWSQTFNEFLLSNPYITEVIRADEDPDTFLLLLQ